MIDRLLQLLRPGRYLPRLLVEMRLLRKAVERLAAAEEQRAAVEMASRTRGQGLLSFRHRRPGENPLDGAEVYSQTPEDMAVIEELDSHLAPGSPLDAPIPNPEDWLPPERKKRVPW